MSKWFGLMFACFVLPAAARAQDGLIKEYAPADFEKLLKETLKKDFEKKDDVYDIKGTDYYARFNPEGKVLLLYAYIQMKAFKKDSFLEVDRWNRVAVHSRAYLEGGKLRVKYEATLNLAAGVTPQQVQSFYEAADREYAKFLLHFGRAPGEKAGEPKPPQPPGKPEALRQGFPAERDPDRADTAWDIEWDIFPLTPSSRILRIVSATFHWKDAKSAPRSLVVVRNLVLAEAFTQYDDKKTCFLDVAMVGTPPLEARPEFLGPACVGKGEILRSKTAAFDNKVYKELHYDGLRFMAHYDGLKAHKGEKLVLWSAIKAGNYIYLVEYIFTDDGRIVSRLGFTAHNFFDRRMNGEDVHPHIGCWRLDFELRDAVRDKGGPERNKIELVSRRRVGSKFESVVEAYPGRGAKEAHEGEAKWVASEFTTLRAESLDVTNGNGKPIAYELISARTGAAADLMPIHNASRTNVDFINYDFWVTHRPKEFRHYYQVPELAKGQPLKDKATTVWHSVAGLHVPRDEDFGPGGVKARTGTALAEWVSFTLRPRNLFDGSPFYDSKTR